MELPSTATAFATGATEDQFKAFLQSQRDYIASLLGESGSKADARLALGIGNGFDLTLPGFRAYAFPLMHDFHIEVDAGAILFKDSSYSGFATRSFPAISLIIGQGVTLGMVSGQQAKIYVGLIFNGTDVEVVACNASGLVIDENDTVNVVSQLGGSATGVIVGGQARTGVPIRIIGGFDVTEATAGQWDTSPTRKFSGYFRQVSADLRFGEGGQIVSVTKAGMKRIGWNVDATSGYCYSDGNANFGSTDAAGVTNIVAGNAVRATYAANGNLTASVTRDSALTYQIYNANAGVGAGAIVQLSSNSGNLSISKLSTASGLAGGGAVFNSGGQLFVGTADSNTLVLVTNNTTALNIDANGNVLAVKATGGLGYGPGSGGAVTQTTSRTTAVALNKPNGDITLFTAAGSATPTTFTVNCNLIGANDVPTVTVRGGTNKYLAFAGNPVAGTSFEVTFWTTGGTASDTPIIHFNLGKGSAS